MEVVIKMDNLQSMIEESLKNNTQAVIDDYVSQKTKSILDRDFGDVIEEEVNSKMKEYIGTYIDNYQIAVGGGFDGTPIQYYTPREYINKIINDTFRDKKFTTYIESSYGRKDKQEVTFEEFIKKTLDPTSQIKTHMNKLAEQVRHQVQCTLKNEYDKSLRDALSGVIMDVIMQNDAFKQINNNIKRLGE